MTSRSAYSYRVHSELKARGKEGRFECRTILGSEHRISRYRPTRITTVGCLRLPPVLEIRWEVVCWNAGLVLVPSTCFARASDKFRECKKFVEIAGVGYLERESSCGLYFGPCINKREEVHGGGGGVWESAQ